MKKPYITDEQINKCILLGILIHQPMFPSESRSLTATKDDKFVSKTSGTEGCWFHSPDEVIKLVTSGKAYYVSHFDNPNWSWKDTLDHWDEKQRANKS